MAWTNSKIFRAFIADMADATAPFDLGADTLKAALFNDSITPDNDAAAADTAYGAGEWDDANEVFDAGQWAQGGEALTGQVVNSGTADVVFFDADDVPSGSAATLADVHGVLVYDDTLTTPVADQGVSYNYLGGANSITNGLFTVAWAATGIWRITL